MDRTNRDKLVDRERKAWLFERMDRGRPETSCWIERERHLAILVNGQRTTRDKLLERERKAVGYLSE
jgi:hypothetical protein